MSNNDNRRSGGTERTTLPKNSRSVESHDDESIDGADDAVDVTAGPKRKSGPSGKAGKDDDATTAFLKGAAQGVLHVGKEELGQRLSKREKPAQRSQRTKVHDHHARVERVETLIHKAEPDSERDLERVQEAGKRAHLTGREENRLESLDGKKGFNLAEAGQKLGSQQSDGASAFLAGMAGGFGQAGLAKLGTRGATAARSGKGLPEATSVAEGLGYGSNELPAWNAARENGSVEPLDSARAAIAFQQTVHAERRAEIEASASTPEITTRPEYSPSIPIQDSSENPGRQLG